MVWRSGQDLITIPFQHDRQRTLKRNITPENSSLRIRASNKEHFASPDTHNLGREFLTLRRAVTVEGNSEGVPSGQFNFCKQVWVSVLHAYVP